MGLQGRPRLKSITKLDGVLPSGGKNPEYSRDVMSAPLGEPECPKHLDKRARAIFKATVALLRDVPELLSTLDATLLANFSLVESQLEILEKGLQAEIAKPVGVGKRKRPRNAIEQAEVVMRFTPVIDKMRIRSNILAREMGLTPAARSSLKVGPVKTTKTVSDHAIDKMFLGSRSFQKM